MPVRVGSSEGLGLTALELHRPVRFPSAAAVTRESLLPLRIATWICVPGEANLDRPPFECVTGVEETDVVGKVANDRNVELVRRTAIKRPD